MKEYWNYNKDAYLLFFKNINRFIGYKLASSIIVVMLLMPFLRWFASIMMKSKGMGYLTNGLVSKFIMSPQGMFLALISMIIGFIVILLELGGGILISHQIITNSKESRFIDLFMYSIKRLKYMLGFDGLIIALYFIIIAPLMDSNIRTTILDNLKIPGFIMDYIVSNDMYLAVLSILFISVLYLMYRWMFALHVLLLDENPKKKFLKKSSYLIKNNFKSTIMYFISSALFSLMWFLIIVIVFGVIIISITLLTHIDFDTGMLIAMILGGILLFAIMIISIPVSMIKLTLFYHHLSGDINELEIKVVDGGTRLNRFLKNKYIISFSIIMAIIGVFLYTFITEVFYNQVKYDVKITAHRGSSFEAPENTLVSIKKAYDNGTDFVEIDVQLTKDEKIILLHDDNFKRTCNVDKKPSEMTLEEIKKLEAGSWFDQKFKGEKIPTLEEVMDYSRGKVKLNIEIKGSKITKNIRKAVVDLIKSKDYINDCIVTSLNYDDILEVEKLEPKIKTGYIIFVAFGDLKSLKTDFYSIEAVNVNEKFINNAHSLGREVHVWTVNEEGQMEEMIKLGVDNIITDYDYKLRALLNENNSKIK